MLGFLGSVFGGGLIAFVIGEIIGAHVEPGVGGPCGGPPVLGFLLRPIGAILLPAYLYRCERRRRAKSQDGHGPAARG
ncbi:MAG TPA: hypothetical protein VN962_03045 [Polyangia bacterium]|nr:hypothetical protein [Polyangia bacterium]